MEPDVNIIREYFDAVRSDDVGIVDELLTHYPTLVTSRWKGRGRTDEKMRSLGNSPYNLHTWIPAPVNPSDPADPRYTSTPLHWTRCDAMVELLVRHGADVNALGTSGDVELLDWFLTPLWRAAHDGRIASVRVLVETGADVNYLNPDGTSQPLMTAAENGHIEVCEFLLENGATADIHSAAMLGRVCDVHNWILTDPSMVSRRDSHGRTPLDAAILLDTFRIPIPQGSEHDDVARLLISHGAAYGLHHAASLGWGNEVKAMIKGRPEALESKMPFVPLLTGAAEFETPISAARRRGRQQSLKL